jgi:hypothetical protein
MLLPRRQIGDDNTCSDVDRHETIGDELDARPIGLDFVDRDVDRSAAKV